jgi:hypothetical protein
MGIDEVLDGLLAGQSSRALQSFFEDRVKLLENEIIYNGKEALLQVQSERGN